MVKFLFVERHSTAAIYRRLVKTYLIRLQVKAQDVSSANLSRTETRESKTIVDVIGIGTQITGTHYANRGGLSEL